VHCYWLGSCLTFLRPTYSIAHSWVFWQCSPTHHLGWWSNILWLSTLPPLSFILNFSPSSLTTH
jgi:hypothetical protein